MKKKYLKIFGRQFNSKWIELTGMLIIVLTFIGAGYSAGTYLSDITCEREKLKITEEYQDKIFEHRQTCNFSKVNDLERKTKAIQLTVEQLKKLQNEK